MYKIIIFLLFPLFLSAETYFSFGAISQHFTTEKLTEYCIDKYSKEINKCNNRHNYIGIKNDINEESQIFIANYKNSLYFQSTAFGFSKKIANLDNSNIFLNVGFVNGYGDKGNQKQFDLFLFPSIVYGIRDVYLELSATYDVLFLTFSIKV